MDDSIPNKIRAAKANTRKAIPYRGNVVDDLRATNGSSHVVLSQFVRNRNVAGLDKPREYQVGNCGEHSSDLFRELLATDINLPIFRVSYPHQNTDHAFNLVGDPRIQHPYIADTWTNYDASNDVVPLWDQRNSQVFPENSILYSLSDTRAFGANDLNVNSFGMPSIRNLKPSTPVVQSWDSGQIESHMRTVLKESDPSLWAIDMHSPEDVRSKYVAKFDTPGQQNMWENYSSFDGRSDHRGLHAVTTNLFGSSIVDMQKTRGSFLDTLSGLPNPYAPTPTTFDPFAPLMIAGPSVPLSSVPSKPIVSSSPLFSAVSPPVAKRVETATTVDPFAGLFDYAKKRDFLK